MQHTIGIRNGILFILSGLFAACQPDAPRMVTHRVIASHWKMRSAAYLHATGAEISSLGFTADGWYRASVPGTVLGALVADSVYQDIFLGQNLEQIPDSLFNVPWWYRSHFHLDKQKPEQIVRLRFNGINYRADIWLNGKKIAASDTIQGGFRRFTFDVSQVAQAGDNVLALKVTRPYPGNLTLGFVDWNPEPPDHNMGLWRNVELLVSGSVYMDQPFVQTKVDTATLDHAWITIATQLHNATDKPVSGALTGILADGQPFSQKVRLKAGESKNVIFSPHQYPQLSIIHPRLWWTHEWGKPQLYNLHLAFHQGDTTSDTAHLRFGIRQISDYFTPDGFRGFRLNGKKILIKGGGWVDPMLLNATADYETAGIDYAVHLHLNTLRMEGFWGQNQHLYDLCDEKGILIMAGFSCQWEWEEYLGTQADQYSGIISPEQNKIAVQSWHDQIAWLRNHPSIFLWLYGSDKQPRPALEQRYIAMLQQLDTTRPALSSAADYTPGITAASKHISSLSGPTGVKMRGPYDYVPPNYWYIDTANGGAYGFNTETSPGPEVPVLESLQKMIPSDSLWPISQSWLYHAARHQFYNLTNYNQAISQRLGRPKSLTDYLRKAQFTNYEGMRAMFEAFETNRFQATGIIQWMYNASWPKLWWQLYDYYLMPTGAFYGCRKANEPVHIAYNYGSNAITVMNNTLQQTDALTAQIQVIQFNMDTLLSRRISLEGIAERQTRTIDTLPAGLPLSRTWFLDLKLYNASKQLVSTNFYVRSTLDDRLDEAHTTWYNTPQTQFADLKDLQHLPAVHLKMKRTFRHHKDTVFFTVQLHNPEKNMAFMVCLNLRGKETGHSIVPVFWADNYLSLLPGESRTIQGYCHAKDLKGQSPEINIDGWNLDETPPGALQPGSL